MTGILNGTYAVLYRELALLKSKMMNFGHVFYIFFSPVIYLAAFGLGLSARMDTSGVEYSAFLVQGIACMSSMNNSYSLVTSSVSMGRLTSGSFQTIVTSPVSSASIIAGLVISGIIRGFLAVFVIMAAGLLMFGVFPFGVMSLFALVMNMFFFSALGVILGLKMQSVETNAFVANFFIMPMAFFSGTFYPVDYLPVYIQKVVYLLPLCHTNILMRADGFTPEAVQSAFVLGLMCAVAIVVGSRMLVNYTD